jgi:FMN phosphatase YigB (HAD superfamily)
MKMIKLVAIDIDGPIIQDSFSEPIRLMIEQAGIPYTLEIEKHIFSRPRKEGAAYFSELTGKQWLESDYSKHFFDIINEYLKEHPIQLVDEIESFLIRLSKYNKKIISFGGMGKEYFEKNLFKISGYFDQYFDTNSIRPGIAEMLDEYKLEPQEVLFIDDVASFAEAALNFGTEFIGLPSTQYQKQLMNDISVQHIYSSVKDIPDSLLNELLG